MGKQVKILEKNENIIEVKDLAYSYKNDEGESHTVFGNISFDIKKGEFITILGRNGSGKSTLAKHFNAILLPDKGKVYALGTDTSDDEKLWELRQNVGMVFQNPDNQIVATIVEEDVAFAPENLGLPPAEIRKRVDYALKAVKMEDFKEHAPHMLSGGQKQRVAIAGILAMKPKVIVLDEATSMLDPTGRKEVMDTMLHLNKDEGITVINITHYMEEALCSDRILVIDKGNLIMSGTPHEIFSKGDELKKIGLDIPQPAKLILELKKNGYEFKNPVPSVGECVCEIYDLYKNICTEAGNV